MQQRPILPDNHTGRDCATLCGRICPKCVERLNGELHTLLDLYRESDHALTAAPSRNRERVSGSRTVGIVLDERAMAVREQLTDVLASWARLVVEAQEDGGPRPREREVGSLVRFLRERVEWIADHPAAVDFDEEVAGLLAEFGGLFGPGPVRRFPLGDCVESGCDGTLRAVMRAAGTKVPSHVSCDAGHVLPPRQWLLIAGRLKESA